SALRTKRTEGGYVSPDLFGREAMASLLAASRQYLAAAYGLHARTEPVCLGAAAFARLVCALWQSNPPIWYVGRRAGISGARHTGRLERLSPNYQVYWWLAGGVKKRQG